MSASELLTKPAITIGPTTKGFLVASPISAAGYVAAGHRIGDESMVAPMLSLSAAAMAHNAAELAAYSRGHGVLLAPHGKTTMSPELFEMQLQAGAWAITVATPSQAMAAFSFGVRRIVIANEVLDPQALAWIGDLGADGCEVLFWLDSEAGVQALAHAGDGRRRFDVLIERGHSGGRTGVRSVAEGLAVARAAAAVAGVRVRGVTGYEGALVDAAAVQLFLRDMVALAGSLARADLLAGDALLSAGGSAYFDVVVEVLGDADIGVATSVVLRSGAYLTHDDGIYVERTPFRRVDGSFRSAIRLWARVLSCPEQGLAIVGAGKRDFGVDEGLPVPLRCWRDGSGPSGSALGPGIDISGWRMSRTNDQHGYLESTDPQATELGSGDLIELGISHPCTTFDKWRVIPVIGDDLRVVDVVATYF